MSGFFKRHIRPAELKEKDGAIWYCTGKKAGKYGGHVYSFEGKPKYVWAEPSWLSSDAKQTKALKQWVHSQKKRVRIFPATEPDPREPLDLGSSPYMAELGFSCEQVGSGHRISLPDAEAFNAAWKKVAESIQEPARKQLKVYFSNGDLLDDVTFARVLTENDVAVSLGREMFHDMPEHLCPLLRCLFELPVEDLEEFQRTTSAIKATDYATLGVLLDRFSEDPIRAEQATFHLAACRDTLSAIGPTTFQGKKWAWTQSAFSNEVSEAIWKSSGWSAVWERRYPGQDGFALTNEDRKVCVMFQKTLQ